MTQRPGRPRSDRRAASAADRFAALADGTRRHLLEQLAAGDRAAGELMAGLDISQPALSQHLRVLREAGLVTAEKHGRNRYYRLRPAGLTDLRDWLDELERFWQARLAALGDYLGKEHR
ncbi:MAG TPA: metalloregulator ArsR/SmtB family transcription factor [Streptosporangiaceae bacterium]|nr:metalloregulator ArsR/SmtB family transcription factor [Streptosporangiaceae bacterium]